MEAIKAKYMISQISPRLLELFLKNTRANKTFSKLDVEDKISKKGELLKRDPTLLGELIEILCDFGILEQDRAGDFNLTIEGAALKKLFLKKPHLFYEIYHVMHFNAYALGSEKTTLLPYKSYNILCSLIYDSTTPRTRKEVASIIDDQIKEIYNVEGSFSEVCITRGIAWLKQLEPPVLDDNDLFNHRESDSPEPLLLALSHFYKIKRDEFGDPIFLGGEASTFLSTSCLIKKDNVETLLKKVSGVFPHLLEVKYNVSGTYLKLKKEVTIAELL